jgi:hypothetical protein
MTITIDRDRMTAALAPIDQAFTASEAKWGVGRLERLVSAQTLASYRRGWVAYRQAISDNDAAAVEMIGPKMVAALAFMEREAEAAGHKPLTIERWEAALEDGGVLVVVRTQAEAHAIARDKSDTRMLVVWTVGELARILPTLEITHAVKNAFPGAEVVRVGGDPVASGVQMTEGQVSDWVRDDPLYDILHGEAA